MTQIYKNKYFKNLVYNSRIESITNKIKSYDKEINTEINTEIKKDINFFLAFLYKCYKKNIIKKSKMIRRYNQLKIYLQKLKKISYLEIEEITIYKFLLKLIIYIQNLKISGGEVEQINIYTFLLTTKKFKLCSNLPWELV